MSSVGPDTVMTAAQASAALPTILHFADFTLDLDGCRLRDANGEEVCLTRGELGLLRAFVQRPGRALSRDFLS